MEKHLQRVKRLKRQVEEQGEKVSDTVYNGILLNSVPEDYNIAVNILESQDRLTPEMIINRLMEASRKHGGEEVSGNGKTKTAMLTNSGQSKGKKSSSSSSPSTKVVVCGHCKQKGHKDTKCWIKHPELRPKKSGSTEKKDEQHFVMSAHVKKTEKAAGEKQSKSDPSKWYIDSAASEHFSPYKHLFESYQELSNPHEITTAEGNTVKGIGKGSITIQAMAGSDIISLTFKDVTYAPDMDANLLSTTTLYDLGFEVSSKPGLGVRILKDDILIADTVREGKLFRLKTVQHQAQSATTTVGESMAVWHRRLAHLGEQNIIKLTRMAEGIQLSKDSILGICGSCQKGKQTRKPSHEPSSRSTERGDLIHCDLCGPITPTTLGGNNYAISFTDDATRMSTIAPLKGKSSAEILRAFKHYRTFLKTQHGIRIKRLRTDGGGEFKKHLAEYLKSKGIKHETTAPYSPDQNGVAERLNRTVIERTKAILAETELPKTLWMEIASTVVYLKNRSPTKALSNQTPYEAWYGEKPDLSHLRSIGCTAYIHIPKERRVKLDWNAHKGQLVEDGGTNQYRIWDPERKDIVISRDVEFDEIPTQSPSTSIPEPAEPTKSTEATEPVTSPEPAESEEDDSVPNSETETETPEQPRRTSARSRAT
jgi:hypothetical protein